MSDSSRAAMDATGTAHPAGQDGQPAHARRQGAFRLMPAPPHLIVMRYVGEDGRRDPEDGAGLPPRRRDHARPAPSATSSGSSARPGWNGELRRARRRRQPLHLLRAEPRHRRQLQRRAPSGWARCSTATARSPSEQIADTAKAVDGRGPLRRGGGQARLHHARAALPADRQADGGDRLRGPPSSATGCSTSSNSWTKSASWRGTSLHGERPPDGGRAAHGRDALLPRPHPVGSATSRPAPPAADKPEGDDDGRGARSTARRSIVDDLPRRAAWTSSR